MAFVYITEGDRLGVDSHGQPIEALDMASPYIVEQPRVAISAGSLPSAPFASSTRFIMLATDAICSLAFAAPTPAGGWTTPTAVVTYHRLGANEVRFYPVKGGQTVAVIANT